ncbi:MAG: efflux RND transporter permease subunit [Nanobdellota archaeon]
MMLEDIAERLAKQQIKRPHLFIGIFILITLVMIPGIFNLVGNIEPSLEKVLPDDIEEVETMNQMREDFGADMMYVLVYPESPVHDVRNPDFLEYLDLIKQKVSENEYIMNVETLADITEGNSLSEVKYNLRENDMASRYVNSAYSMSVIHIKSDTGASAELINQVVESLEKDIADLESQNPGARTEITGFNAIDKATFEVIMSDFAKITLFSMLFVGIVVFLTFRRLGKTMLPLSVLIVALLWTMGLVGYLGLTITVVSMVAAAMIMGLGIDFGIHQVHSYFEKRKKMDKKRSLIETVKELLRAMLGASLTTSAGFLALLFGVLPAMKVLGVMLAIGILFTLTGAVFLLPVLIYTYEVRR